MTISFAFKIGEEKINVKSIVEEEYHDKVNSLGLEIYHEYLVHIFG